MKKSFLISLVVCAACGLVRAQSTQIAVLNHGGALKSFYGVDALIKAHGAAENGDVVTLSTGLFNGTTITKGITLQGSGMTIDKFQTIINEGLEFNVSDTTSQPLHFEGIYVGQETVEVACLKNATFMKCRFYNLDIKDSSSIMDNVNFIHVRVVRSLTLPDSGSIVALNSVLRGVSGGYHTVYNIQNCVVHFVNTGEICNAYIYNNVIVDAHRSSFDFRYFPSGIGCYNNVFEYHFVEGGWTYYRVFNNITNNTNTITQSSICKSLLLESVSVNLFSDQYDYHLNDTTSYIGTDGKQIGIYGGNMPYDETPTNPRIVKFYVDSKSSAEGKLNIEIEVKGNE